MSRSPFFRGLAVVGTALGLIAGCSETPTEGDLPPSRVASPEELQDFQKKLEQEKVSKGAEYKRPPGITIPRQ